MQILEPMTRRWTREEYNRIGDIGLFEGQRVELIEGEIIQMSPKRSPHSVATGLAFNAISAAFGPGFWIRNQEPLNLGLHSEPEPDLAVVKGTERDYHDHPTTALLVVEVSESTLAFDRSRKASLYARAGIPEYWIVNLVERRLEVHRNPVPDAAQQLGFSYARVTSLAPADQVAPLQAPAAKFVVADLLP